MNQILTCTFPFCEKNLDFLNLQAQALIVNTLVGFLHSLVDFKS